jgi:hypothetical protein
MLNLTRQKRVEFLCCLILFSPVHFVQIRNKDRVTVIKEEQKYFVRFSSSVFWINVE